MVRNHGWVTSDGVPNTGHKYRHGFRSCIWFTDIWVSSTRSKKIAHRVNVYLSPGVTGLDEQWGRGFSLEGCNLRSAKRVK